MSVSMFVEIERSETVSVGRIICSKVTEREAPVIENELVGSARGVGWRLVVDLTDVGLLASVGLGMLVTLHRTCRENGGRLAIIGVNSDVMGALKISRLDRHLIIKKDLQSALKALA